jgi:hypothetical protein
MNTKEEKKEKTPQEQTTPTKKSLKDLITDFGVNILTAVPMPELSEGEEREY